MNSPIASDWTVRDILQTCPETAQVFFRFKTDCVGCWLQRFCTLEDVCGNYTLEMNDVLKTLQDSSAHKIQRRTL